MAKKHSSNWGGARPGAGGKGLKPGIRRVEHRETELQVIDTAARTKIIEALKGVSGAPLALWFRTIIGLDGVEKIEVQKKIFGQWAKVADLSPVDVEPDKIESVLLNQAPFGPAQYTLKALHEGDYVGSGRSFVVGGEDAVLRSEPTARGLEGTLEDGEAAISRALKQRAGLLSIRNLDDLLTTKKEGGEDDMKPDQLLQLAAALKPERQDMSPLLSILENNARAAEARAEKAEARTHDLMMKQMEAATSGKSAELSSGASILTALGPVLEFIKPILSPGLLKGLIGSFVSQPAPEGGWTPEGIMNALKGLSPLVEPFMPTIMTMLQSAMAKQATAAPSPAPVMPAPAMIAAPQPNPNGGEPVQNPLQPVYDALIGRLQKPADDFDPKKLCAFCASVIIHPDGATLLSVFETLSDTDDDLAKVSLGHPMYDSRFTDAQTWPGVVRLLNYIRKTVEDEEEARRKDEAEHDNP